MKKYIHPLDLNNVTITNGMILREWKTLTLPIYFSKNEMRNYYFETEDARFLMLDNYGDEIISSRIKRKLFGTSNYTVAININTRNIYLCCFVPGHLGYSEDFCEYSIVIEHFTTPKIIPDDFNIDSLVSSKRPFRISIPEFYWVNFMEREIGYQALREEFLVVLRGDSTVEIGT